MRAPGPPGTAVSPATANVPQCTGTTTRGRSRSTATAARAGSRWPGPSVGPQPQTGSSATSSGPSASMPSKQVGVARGVDAAAARLQEVAHGGGLRPGRRARAEAVAAVLRRARRTRAARRPRAPRRGPAPPPRARPWPAATPRRRAAPPRGRTTAGGAARAGAGGRRAGGRSARGRRRRRPSGAGQGPIRRSGPTRPVSSGSVSTTRPPISTRTVECPRNVSRTCAA